LDGEKLRKSVNKRRECESCPFRENRQHKKSFLPLGRLASPKRQIADCSRREERRESTGMRRKGGKLQGITKEMQSHRPALDRNPASLKLLGKT